MRKYICVINGRGGVGKDTLIDAVSKKYNVVNVSSITPIKVIADKNGWWHGGKSDAERRLLAGLKQVLDEYNGTTLKYLVEQTAKFLAQDNAEVLFIHIREPENIAKYIDAVDEDVATILIESERAKDSYGNQADDNVENYAYDYYYQNDLGIDVCGDDFVDWFYETVIEPREHSHYYKEFKVIHKLYSNELVCRGENYRCAFDFEVGRTCDDERLIVTTTVSDSQEPRCTSDRATVGGTSTGRTVVLPNKVIKAILVETEKLRQQAIEEGIV